MHAGAAQAAGRRRARVRGRRARPGDPAASRRCKLKVVAAADSGRGREGRRVHRCRRLAREDHHRVPLGRSPAGRAGGRAGRPVTTPPREALDAGLVSPEHAAVIVRATGQLPDTVSAEQRQVVEAVPGGEGSPVQSRPAPPHRPPRDRGRRTRPEDRRRPRERAHPHRRASSPGEVLTDAARQRRRHHHRTLHHPRARRGDARQGHRRDDRTPTDARARLKQQDRSFDWRHRRGLAFAELLEHLPTDHLHTKSAATVVVTIDHTVLAGAMKAAHLDTDQTLSAGEARRLACNAGILPAVLGSKSVALDLGRESRLFSESQRLAKGLEHTTCAATGCERPYAWCELHHRQPWAKGGRPTSPTRSRSATSTTTGSTTPASTTRPCPTAPSGSAGVSDHHLHA